MNSARSFDTHSDEETRALARSLAGELASAKTILLIGNLGAGKTTFTKGLAEGLGAASADEVASPTYTLIHEYGEPVRLYHVDLYRLDRAEEVRRLGLEELFDAAAPVVLEWAERFPELLPSARLEIRISQTGDTDRHFDLITISDA